MSRNLSRPPSSASFRKSAEHSDFNKSFNNSGSWCSEVGRPQTPLSARARMGSDSARATPVPRPHSAMGSARGGDSGGGGVKVSTVPTLSKPPCLAVAVEPCPCGDTCESYRRGITDARAAAHLSRDASLAHSMAWCTKPHPTRTPSFLSYPPTSFDPRSLAPLTFIIRTFSVSDVVWSVFRSLYVHVQRINSN